MIAQAAHAAAIGIVKIDESPSAAEESAYKGHSRVQVGSGNAARNIQCAIRYDPHVGRSIHLIMVRIESAAISSGDRCYQLGVGVWSWVDRPAAATATAAAAAIINRSHQYIPSAACRIRTVAAFFAASADRCQDHENNEYLGKNISAWKFKILHTLLHNNIGQQGTLQTI